MPPPASLAGSTLLIVNNLTKPRTVPRSIASAALLPHTAPPRFPKAHCAMANPPAFATTGGPRRRSARNIHISVNTNNGNGLGVFGRFSNRRTLRLGSFVSRGMSPSTSSVPSVASSSDDGSSDGSGGRTSRSVSRRFSTGPGTGSGGGSGGASGADGDSGNGSNGRNGSKLSSARGRHAVNLLPSYLVDARAIRQYSPSHPDGALQLSVAENRLSELPVPNLVGLVEQTKTTVIDQTMHAGGITTIDKTFEETGMRLVDVLSLLASSDVARPSDDAARATNVFAREMIYYQPTHGMPGAREAVADYLQRLLVSPSLPPTSSSSALKFNPDNVVLGAGCNAVLENLCMVLADPGDAVLIPTPYYAAFEFDLVARAGCHIVPVNTMEHRDEPPPRCGETIPAEFYYPTRSALEVAYACAAGETGRAPRILLLSHPNNPLGVCYPPAVVRECIDWCRERGVHLISDEIYAGSVYREGTPDGGRTFESAMALGSGHEVDVGGGTRGLGLGPYVHLVYALSKDFALSGLRAGAAYTENEEILLPLQKLNDLCQISSQTQLLVERMLTAEAVMRGDGSAGSGRKFVDVYLEANRDNIRERCDALLSCLDELGIPYLPADAGLFAWMDLREFLPPLPHGISEANESTESRERRERELYLTLMREHGLLFTPGMSMRCERAGFFRFVFTAASQEEFELGLERLRGFVREMRN